MIWYGDVDVQLSSRLSFEGDTRPSDPTHPIQRTRSSVVDKRLKEMTFSPGLEGLLKSSILWRGQEARLETSASETVRIQRVGRYPRLGGK